MELIHILVFTAGALAIGLLADNRLRRWLMLGGSLLAIYWLQSATPIRRLDFWLPTATVAITVITWAATYPSDEASPNRRQTWLTAAVMGGMVLLIGVLRYIPALCCLNPTRPPQIYAVLVGVIVVGGLSVLLLRVKGGWRVLALGGLLTVMLLALKWPPAAAFLSGVLRSISAQSVEQASALDIRWLGVSYVVFRLLHTLLDRWYGRLPALSLRDFVIYVIFFPAITAGPIDRAERFTADLDEMGRLDAAALYTGGSRIVLGLFMKYGLADGLALISLDAAGAAQTTSAGWTWVMVYGYALRLFLDFAGYTHIAIGIGQLMGIKLPENFDSPYLKPNLTAFWNSWHITLAQWFRAYYFNPVSRWMRKQKWSTWIIIAVMQLTTMVLIGLWHGVTWNFVIWGAWHGVGLFIHNRWTQAMRLKMRTYAKEHPRWNRVTHALSVLVTFHFVTLGWVWFALPSVELSADVLMKLFGI